VLSAGRFYAKTRGESIEKKRSAISYQLSAISFLSLAEG
jgi:hypothetical protein